MILLWHRKFWNFLRSENLDKVMVIILIIITINTITISWLEPDISKTDALWWSIVTLTTVGYGDITPVTVGGRFIAILDMFVGIGFLAIFTATIAGIFVDKKIKNNLGMGSYNFNNHLIICEWNYRAKFIINELRRFPKTQDDKIILIANIDRKPIEDNNLFFIKGNVCDETLNRANLMQARTVIILGDDSIDHTARDAKVILSTLTVESINPNAYTVVELVDEAHVKSCQRAKVDEIIVSSELSSMLISQAALNHGITKVVSEILSTQSGNKLYKIAIPDSRVGSSFMEVFTYMKQAYQSIVLAVQKGIEGDVISNPPTDYKLENGDYLIVVAQDEPRPLNKF